MTTKKQTTENVKKPEEKVITQDVIENEGRTEISLMPNWENTHTWMVVCRQILSQRVKTPSASTLFKKVDNAKAEKEKFALIYTFADEQIKILEKRIETLKSVSEIANYETTICMKRDDKL